jgi:REP element-mobilizing transposase RayT
LKELEQEQDSWRKENPEPWNVAQKIDYKIRFGERIHEWLDAGYGSCLLKFSEVRAIAQECLLRFDGDRMKVHAAVIMPNHVHALIQPLKGHELSKLLKGIKGTSARLINKLLSRSGYVWMDESYDHIVRDREEYAWFCKYICENPVKAGLWPEQYWIREGRGEQ